MCCRRHYDTHYAIDTHIEEVDEEIGKSKMQLTEKLLESFCLKTI